MKNRKSESQKKEVYSDEEINELAEWLEDLTLKQAFFLKESYESFLKIKTQGQASSHVH